jgi:hypothetical protein
MPVGVRVSIVTPIPTGLLRGFRDPFPACEYALLQSLVR